MLELSGFHVLEELYISNNTAVYRGIERETQQPVVLKILNSKYPTPKELAQFKHQYEITKSLEIDGIVKSYRLEPYQNGLILVLEDFGGNSLRDSLDSQPLKLDACLKVASKLAETLAQIHQNNIIHKDIKTQNIIFNPATEEVKVTDFSIASLLSRENQSISSPNLVEGTLAYISPEQTGRMNRSVDYRTDFYSLGVTFYELLTGELPFQSIDPLELIHFHIAKLPTPLHEKCPEVPRVVSDIVMKLLAKTAEDRYQSGYALKADIDQCLQQLQATGKIEHFVVGQHNRSNKFQICQKLYGRDVEIATLIAAFERSSQGKAEMMLVSGYSGIGKTALINEIHKPIGQRQGYFISGKFDQFKRNIPYFSLIQAFKELIRQILTESAQKIQIWQQELLTALGANGQLIINVIPEVEQVIGSQPEVPELGGTESHNRFNLVFQNFINVFTQAHHPLVLFLDDLQWSDSASLKLIQLLMTSPNTHHLLLIGAYRDREVNAAHPLMGILDEIQQHQTVINNISLSPLQQADIQELIAGTLYCHSIACLPLAQLVYKKTAGNPFFVNQFLQSLYDQQHICFNQVTGNWEWDLAQIEAKDITDNVVELVANRIQQLLPSTQHLLQLAACIGNRFDLKTLAIVNEQSVLETAAQLWEGVEQELIVPLGDDYKYLEADSSTILYRFLHDRVQQAAYSLIDSSRQQAVHLKVGQLLLQNTADIETEEKIFDIVNHLNFGSTLISQNDERLQLANINLIAGKKAKSSTAFESALNYFKTGKILLLDSDWETSYKLTFYLSLEQAECEHLVGNFKGAEHLFDYLLKKAQTSLDKSKIYNLKVTLYAQLGRHQEVLQTTKAGLGELDLQLPEDASEFMQMALQVKKEALAIIGDRPIASLLDLPVMHHPESLIILEILENAAPSAHFLDPAFVLFLGFKMLQLTLQYGNAPNSTHAYVMAGIVILAGNDLESAYTFGKLAVSFSDYLHRLDRQCRTYLCFALIFNSWRKHVRESLSYARKAYQYAMEAGDYLYASWSAFVIVGDMLTLGHPLSLVSKECDKYCDFVQKTVIENAPFVIATQQIALHLQGLTTHSSFDETLLVQQMHSSQGKMPLQWYYILKMQELYLLENYEAAYQIGIESDRLTALPSGHFQSSEHYVYYPLVLTAIYTQVSAQAQTEFDRSLQECQQKLKFWADNCPENFLHKYLLISAEITRVTGQFWEAADLYDRAITTAHQHEYFHHEALANELAAKFYLAQNKSHIAQLYLTKALYGYLRWEANAKVDILLSQYPQFLRNTTAETKQSSESKVLKTTSSTTTSRLESLDLMTAIKAAQALSGEMILSNLLHQLMKIAIENAGAQKGVLLLEREGQLFIEAIGQIDEEESNVLSSVPVHASQDLPQTVIAHVARTGQALVLNDATRAETFATDTYILSHQPKSVLCMPVIHQGKLTGILYLENNLTTGIFTSDRLEILKLLAAQAAISIENARLYTNLTEATTNLKISNEKLEEYSRTLEQKVSDRTEEIQGKNQQLAQALTELTQTQSQLIQREKMSSLGQLVAGVAHEINNPVNFIYGNIQHLSGYTEDLFRLLAAYQAKHPQPDPDIAALVEEIDLEFVQADLPKTLSSMKVGADRIRQIVLSLRNFSRLDEADMKSVDIHEGIDNTLLILQHRLKGNAEKAAIAIIKEYEKLPLVNCYAGQLNQVFMNIIANAIDALEIENVKEPTIRIRTNLLAENQVSIQIWNNGSAIPKDVQARLFDPFFTTKPVGIGTGLGLSISYQIVVSKHGGKLYCHSEPDLGTEFVIQVPINQNV